MRLAALAVALVGTTAAAQEATKLAPETAPAPEMRPEHAAPEAVPQLIPPAEAPASEPGDPAGPGAVPQLIPPEEMPSRGAAPGGEEGSGESSAGEDRDPSDTEAAKEEPLAPPMREVLAEAPAELSACLAALDDLGVAYERADPITDPDDRECGIANPVVVTELAEGVAIEPPPTLRCEAALAAARWVGEVAVPLSRRLPDRGRLAAIEQGTSYLCRPRADGEISEHAFGNALDIMGFRFDSGDPLVIEPRDGDGTLDEAFEAAVRAGACLDFTTVLGPGQEDHADHLHLDVKARDGGFRICQ